MRVLLSPSMREDPGPAPALAAFDAYEVDRPVPPGRPWVLANMVAGLDGSASVGGRVGPLSGPSDRELFVRLRAVADVVLVGAGTVRAERYGPVRLADVMVERRLAAGRPAVPPVAVVTRSLALDWSSSLFDEARQPRPIVVTAAAADAASIDEASRHAEVVIAGDASVDLARALDELHRRGHRVVLTEGGPALLGELIAADLLDELCLTLTPLVGGDPLPIAEPPTAGLVPFDLVGVLEDEGTVFLRYLVRRVP